MQIEYDYFLSDDPATVATADAYFARPGRNIWYDPWVASVSLVPLLRIGRRDDAIERYPIAVYRRYCPGYVWSRRHHLESLGRTGDVARGVKEFEAQLPVALAQPDPLSHYYFLRPAAVLFDRMAAAGPRPVRVRRPGSAPWATDGGLADVSTVRDWLRAEAAAVAARFDARSGNDFFPAWLRPPGGS